MILIIAALVLPCAIIAESTNSNADGAATDSNYKLFEVGAATYTYDINDSTGEFPTLDELTAILPEGQEFNGWFVDDGTDGYNAATDIEAAAEPLFMPGSTYSEITTPTTADSYTAYISDISYTVNFVDSDGSDIRDEKFTIENTSPITAPSEKENENETPGYIIPDGMVFIGWADESGSIFSADASIAISDIIPDDGTTEITLTATYEADPVITFVVDDITTYTHTMTDIEYPTDPVKSNFEFLGWADESGNIVIPAEMTIAELKSLELDENATFTATFEPALHTVSFTVNDTIVSTQTVRHGELATEPAFVPAVDGYVFADWNYDFDTAITDDTTISAEFDEYVAPEPTGLADPVIQTAVILFGIALIAILALFVSKMKSGAIVIGRGPNAKTNVKIDDKEDSE